VKAHQSLASHFLPFSDYMQNMKVTFMTAVVSCGAAFQLQELWN
jgi:hypothetical protein